MLTDELKLCVCELVDLSSVLRIWFHNIYTDTLEMKKYYSFINFLHFYSSWTLSKLFMCLSAYFDLLLNWQQLLKSSFSDSFWSVSESCRVCPFLGAWDFKIMSFCLVFPPGKGSVTVIEALLPQAVYTHTDTDTQGVLFVIFVAAVLSLISCLIPFFSSS